MVGIVGDRETALATARAILVRLTVHHGPADFRLAIITDVPADWMWCSWLPHARLDALSGRYRLASREEDVEAVIASLTQDSGDAALLVVVDAPGFDPRLRARLAALVDGGSIAAVVVESSMDRLPGTCGTIVTVAGPLGCVRCPSVGDVTEVKVDGVAYDVANGTARHLYGVDDPEEHHEGARLPSRVGLGELHDGRLEVDDLIHRWRNSPPGLVATIGVTENGPLTIDLVADGPHGLVAGTTGSGKSEFLRSMIGALALRYGPDRVTFALVDYKGGSAFDACAGLPHVVGLITDLDRRLGSRALQSLEAELRHRERVLREVGVDHIDAYPRLDGLSPLPRLLVMIDEFAALAADVPEFVPSLVDIAQRGRSLGVHLILATQRPAGVVGEAIRANTNLRVALRVQTVADSRDVIDDAVAAHLPRRFPGRGFVRLGPGELVPFQSAYGAGLLDSEQPSGLLVETIEFGWEPVVAPEAQAASEAKPATGTSELDRLTEVALASFARLGWNRPRASWAPPLPESLEIGSAPSGNRGAIGVVDRPDEQTTAELQWSPELGGLLSFGVDGSGATDAVVAAAGASALAADPGQLHVYGIDAGRGRLHEMESWPHVGAVVRVGERERLLRLIRRLHGLLETRRRSEVRDPTVLVVVDRIDGLLATLDGPGDVGAREMFSRVAVDGPRFGVLPLLSAERPGSVPAAIASSIGQRLCFRLADPFEYAAVGLAPRDVPDLVRGRGFDSGGRLVQVGRLSSEALLRVKAMEPTGSAAPDIGILPDRVPLEAVSHGARLADGGRFVPIGLGDRDLLPVGFRLHAGDHVLVAGPARSGRTTTLASIARLASAGDQSLEIVALAREGSLLETVAERTCRSADELVQKVQERSAPTLVLIDDAERIDHPGIARLLGQPEDGLHVVAAGRADVLRGMYQHWTRDIRRCRLGLSLCPQPDLDGELWQTQFPRRGPSLSQPGRGYLVAGGEIEVVQVAAS
jgi:S-DNA-T family DNA segregation ATPase FtsK/SpoIIIE